MHKDTGGSMFWHREELLCSPPEVWCKMHWPDRENTDGALASLCVPGLIQEKGCFYFLVYWEMEGSEWQLLYLQFHLLFFNGEYSMRVCAYSGPSTFISELGFLDWKMSRPEIKGGRLFCFFFPHFLRGGAVPGRPPYTLLPLSNSVS